MRARAIGRPILAAILLLTGARPLLAAGYALREQSTTAQGNAFAGATAGADDVSYMFFNPAALGYVDKFELPALATLVAPKVELKTPAGSTVLGTPISGSTQDDDIAENAVVPAFYAGRAAAARAACRDRRERPLRPGDASTRATGSAATTASSPSSRRSTSTRPWPGAR